MGEVLEITGAIEPADCFVLADLARKKTKEGAVFVEVGSWQGLSSSVLAIVIKSGGGTLYCIDHWKGSEGTDLAEEAAKENIYNVFERNLRILGLWDYITPMVMDSLTASKKFEDESIDFLFLDADHRYKQFKEDLDAWIPKIKIGGMICGHDSEAYYSLFESQFREMLDKHVEEDFTLGYHMGVIKGLYDFFYDTHSLIEGTRIWFKEVCGS